MATWIVGLILLVIVLLVCRYVRAKAKTGGCSGCGGGCSACGGSCQHTHRPDTRRPSA
ncbi:MAG TPA: FeoB-associated Cys-rich membrane protein [Candidatus Gallacutalibacter pullicola]|uniref:FeoB-associated Cys-rich membrane protein n=1 Tax=Candidatus Gallacutalibacter pullicola TaxID=2840830 RepID=A0A9D1DNT1_9FIRM|nr:FeoB-associated Cys-rich membrane protein [Candidatus Gallacutalibacter pullicola]